MQDHCEVRIDDCNSDQSSGIHLVLKFKLNDCSGVFSEDNGSPTELDSAS